MKTLLGKNLKVGHTLEVLSPTHLRTIKSLTPYHGPLAYLFKEGSQLATTTEGPGITIDNSDYYKVL